MLPILLYTCYTCFSFSCARICLLGLWVLNFGINRLNVKQQVNLSEDKTRISKKRVFPYMRFHALYTLYVFPCHDFSLVCIRTNRDRN